MNLSRGVNSENNKFTKFFDDESNDSNSLQKTLIFKEQPLPLYVSVDANGNYYFKRKNFNYSEKNIIFSSVKENKKENIKNHQISSFKNNSNMKMINNYKRESKSSDNVNQKRKNSKFNPMNLENENLIHKISKNQRKELPFLAKRVKNKYCANLNLMEIREEKKIKFN